MVKLISFKIMFERVRGYIGILQFLMIGYMFIQQTEFNLLTTIFLVGVVSVVLAIIDFKYIYPAEQKRIMQKNPVIMEIYNDVKEIRRCLNENS